MGRPRDPRVGRVARPLGPGEEFFRFLVDPPLPRPLPRGRPRGRRPRVFWKKNQQKEKISDNHNLPRMAKTKSRPP